MVERQELRNLQALLTSRAFPAWVGRLVGAFIVVAAIAQAIVLGFRYASVSGGNPFWNILAGSLTPLALGFLLLVASEILRRMGQETQP